MAHFTQNTCIHTLLRQCASPYIKLLVYTLDIKVYQKLLNTTVQWDLHYPGSFVPVQFKICSDNWICSDKWNQWSHNVMDLVHVLWLNTQFKYTYCYVQCTLYTVSLFSYSVSTKVGC